MTIQTALTDAQILACRDVMLALRPHVAPEDFLPAVRRQMTEGYHLVYVEPEGRAVSAAGFRYQRKLFSGHIIYIDDLSTLPDARADGFAGFVVKGQVFDYADAASFFPPNV